MTWFLFALWMSSVYQRIAEFYCKDRRERAALAVLFILRPLWLVLGYGSYVFFREREKWQLSAWYGLMRRTAPERLRQEEALRAAAEIREDDR